MNQFIQRITSYVANEVIIKGLANSRTFQKFALRTDANLKNVHKMGAEHLESIVKPETAATNNMGRPVPPRTGFPGFVSAFFKEIRKDLGTGS